MKGTFALLMVVTAWTGAFGQAEVPAEAVPSVVDCRTCHLTGSPTKEKPSLQQCQRAMSSWARSAKQAPPVITYGSGKEGYGRVEFSHGAHAEMAEMGGGCYRCHHYDHGGMIQKCGSCHSAARARSDLSAPDLKGALHQLCIGCHKEWGHSTNCAVCHGGKVLPKPEVPRTISYRTAYNPGKLVSFMHGEHISRFGLKCSKCHQGQACETCHDPGKNGAPPRGAVRDADPMAAAHLACFSCHAKDNCASCHAGRPMEAYDHAKSSGWRLNRFHNALQCRACHVGGKFGKLGTGCESCHKDWQGRFEHKKTGLALDETHSALGCGACHGDEAFRGGPALFRVS